MTSASQPDVVIGRPFLVSRRFLLLVALLLGLAMLPYPGSPAVASCAGPSLEVHNGQVLERGASLLIEGRVFVDGCQDSMSCSRGLGCDSCKYDDPPPRAMDDVTLRLVQGDRTWELGVADAEESGDHLGWVSWPVELPRGVKPGPAMLEADPAPPVRVRIR